MPPLPTRPESDAELMLAVQGGDAAALDALWVRHHARLFSFLARWTGDDHAAEDLVQDTFLTLLRVPERYRDEGTAFIAWLVRVARNLAIDRYRVQHATDSLGGDAEPADDRPLALDRLTAEESTRQLEDVLAALPLAHREVLLLRGVEGMGHREIGVVLNCSEGAARVRLHRASAALRTMWRTRYGDDG